MISYGTIAKYLKNKYIRPVFVLLIVFIPIAAANAQDGKLVVSVDPQKVTANAQFQLTFTFSGTDVNSVGNFKPPGFGQFVVISGPSQSVNTLSVNGKVSASVSYTYVLYSRQAGKYKIGSATLEYKGKPLQSDPLEIEIVQGGQKKQSKQENQGSNINVGDNLFLKVIPDKQRVRLGEQLTVTYKLYNRLILASEPQFKYPTSDGFWAEDFDSRKSPRSRETVNGKVMDVYTIKKTALFATQAGNLKVSPLEATCTIQIPTKRRNNDLFDQFFNDPFFQQTQTANVEIKSNSLAIAVDPIPANAPSGYSGAIGRYTFNATVDKHNIKAGDPITLKLTVSGTGNIKLITLPKPALPADIESYEPKISEEISRDGSLIHGKKTAEYLLIPRNAGQRILEPMVFVFFDLDKKEYITQRSPQFEFTIEPGKDFSNGGINIAAKEDVRILGQDIRFLKLSIGNLQQTDDTNTSVWFVLGLLLPPLIFAGAWLYRKRMEKVYGDMPRLLFEKAGREASRRLKKAGELLEQGNAESYHAEVFKALTEYLEHKLRTPKSALVMDEAVSRLRKHGVEEEVVRSLKTCMERAEFVRYAPGSDTTRARKELLDIAADTINRIDQTFGKREKK